MTNSFAVDNLQVSVYEQGEELGQAAADFVVKKLRQAILDKGQANLILATGASQFSFRRVQRTT